MIIVDISFMVCILSILVRIDTVQIISYDIHMIISSQKMIIFMIELSEEWLAENMISSIFLGG